VILPEQARDLAARLAEHGFEPIGVDLSELRKAGGGPKCCTLELRN
jgi:N-dimethylarginine dimethylaminohydrolase